MKHLLLLLLLFVNGLPGSALQSWNYRVGCVHNMEQMITNAKVSKHCSTIDTITPPKEYLGYRLFLSAIKVQKKTDNWVRIQFNLTNTGRNDVDFDKKGTEHWVQFQFDNSLFESKLGGLRTQIRYAFYKSGFKFKMGQTYSEQVLKVEVFPSELNRRKPSIAKTKTPSKEVKPKEKTVFATVSGQPKTEKEIEHQKVQCPDLVIEEIKVISETKKWLTIEYTLTNIGRGPIDLIERAGSQKIKLAVRAHISGVPKLSKGALPIGGGYVGLDYKDKGITLFQGDQHKEKLKVDIRSKTKYMKHLILSLDANAIRYECDRTNNTNAIELE